MHQWHPVLELMSRVIRQRAAVVHMPRYIPPHRRILCQCRTHPLLRLLAARERVAVVRERVVAARVAAGTLRPPTPSRRHQRSKCGIVGWSS